MLLTHSGYWNRNVTSWGPNWHVYLASLFPYYSPIEQNAPSLNIIYDLFKSNSTSTADFFFLCNHFKSIRAVKPLSHMGSHSWPAWAVTFTQTNNIQFGAQITFLLPPTGYESHYRGKIRSEWHFGVVCNAAFCKSRSRECLKKQGDSLCRSPDSPLCIQWCRSWNW